MSAWVWAGLTVLFWGIAPIFDKLGVARTDPLLAVGTRSFTVSLAILGTLALSGRLPRLATVDGRSVLLLAAGGLSASFLAHFTFLNALKLGEASRLVPVTSAFPAITVILAALLLGEKLTWAKGGGVILVVLGILLIRRG